jgi:hypothetical protein
MDTHAVDGLCARSSPFCVDALGRAEARIFANGFEEWSKPESWVRVIVRGFALRKESYVAVGGFEHRYSRFAEWLLSARLRSRGFQLDYAPGVGVHHRDGGSFPFYAEEIREFTEGECLFRLESDSPAFVRTYFGSPQEWAAARAARGRPVGAIVKSLLQLRRRSSPVHANLQAYLALFVRSLVDGLFADRRLLLKHQARVWMAQLHYWSSITEDQRFRAFEAFYVADTSLSRVRFALDHSEDAPAHSASCATYALEAMDDVDLYGFSGLDHFGGQSFRWSSDAAAIRLRATEAAEYKATIQVVGVRPIDPEQELAVFVDAHPVSGLTFDPNTWQLTFTIPAAALQKSSQQWLIIHANRWRHPDLAATEDRHLGLPIASLTFRKESDA